MAIRCKTVLIHWISALHLFYWCPLLPLVANVVHGRASDDCSVCTKIHVLSIILPETSLRHPVCYIVQQTFDVSLQARTDRVQFWYLTLCCELGCKVVRLVQISVVLWDSASGICRPVLQMHEQMHSHGRECFSLPSAIWSSCRQTWWIASDR